MNITDEQSTILKNTLGLNYKDRPYRNYYTLGYGSPHHFLVDDMVNKGYMENVKSTTVALLAYKATQKGIDLVYTPKKKKNKKDVIRIGDTVKIVNPKIIKRVGYPLCTEDIVRNHMTKGNADMLDFVLDKLIYGDESNGLTSQTKEILEDWGISFPMTTLANRKTKKMEKLFEYIIRECAYIRLKNMGFGGNKRTIHYDDTEAFDIKGLVFKVTDKKIQKTGDRVPGYNSYNYYDVESEGPSFAETGTHIILTVEWQDPKFVYGDGQDPFKFMRDTITDEKYKKFQIEACDVEKMNHDRCLE